MTGTSRPAYPEYYPERTSA